MGILPGCRVGVGAQDCLQPGQPGEVQQALGCEEQVQELQVPEGRRARGAERRENGRVVWWALNCEISLLYSKYRDGGNPLCLTRFSIALRFVPDSAHPR